MAAGAGGSGSSGGGGSGGPAATAAPAEVKVQFRAVGSAPLLKRTKFKVPGSELFATVVVFLRRQLQLGEAEPLHVYVGSAFAPSPSQVLGDVHRSFGVDGELVLSYSLTPAYG